MILKTLGPRQYIQHHSPKIERWNKITPKNDAEYLPLCLPYFSENMTNEIRKYIINHNLPKYLGGSIFVSLGMIYC